MHYNFCGKFAFTSFPENMSYICRIQEGVKLRSRYCIILKNRNILWEEFNISFQYFKRFFKRFLKTFLTSLIKSTFSTVPKEKELHLHVFFIAAILGCLLHFITNFNVGQDNLSERGSMLFVSGNWSEVQLLKSNQ